MRQSAQAGTDYGLFIGIYVAFCGVSGLLATFQWRSREQFRKAAATTSSIYLGLCVVALVVFGGLGIFAKGRNRSEDLSLIAIMALVSLAFLLYGALLFRLQRMTPGFIPQRSIPRAVRFIIGAVFFVGVATAAAIGVAVIEYRKSSIAEAAASARPEQLVKVPEFNYQIRSPGGRWVRGEKGALNPEASLSLVNSVQNQYFIVIAEDASQVDGYTLDTLLATVRTNGASAAEVFNAEPVQKLDVAGVPGLFLPVEVKISGMQMKFFYWVGLHQGMALQLLTWGKFSDAPKVEQTARDLLNRFSFMDPDWSIARAKQKDSTSQFAPEYGLTLDLAGTGWYPQKDSADEDALQRFSLVKGGAHYLQVVPVNIRGNPLPDERIDRGLLRFYGWDFPAEKISKTGEHESDGVRVSNYIAESESDGVRYAYRFRILRRGDIACLVAAWQAASRSDRAELDQVLDRVTLGEPGPADQSPQLGNREGYFWNGVGLAYFHEEKLDLAESAFRRAAEAAPKDQDYTANVGQALVDQKKFDQAASFLSEHPVEKPAERYLSILADALSGAGDTAGAIDAYGRMLSIPAARQKALNARNALFISANRFDDADKDLDQHKSLGPNRTLRAKILRARGQVDEAAATLRAGLETDPIDTAAGEDFIELCVDLDRYTDIIDASDRLSKSGYRTAYTLYQKGSAEFALDRLPAARQTLEEAQKLVPTDKTVKELLQRVQTRLGQGDPTLFKDPIEAVAIPPQTLDGATPMKTDAGVIFHHRVICYKFEPGVHLLQTVHYRFTVLDRRGIDAVSSFQFEFDPDSERMFVNKLEVRDEQGQVVFTGALPNYFISSDNSTELASQSVNLHVPVSGLAPGRTVELVVTRREAVSGDELPFRRTFLSGGYATERAAVVVETPNDQFRYRVFNDPRAVTLPGATAFLADHRPDWPSEPMQAPAAKFLPLVVFGGAKSDWASLGHEYLKIIADRLAIPDSVRALAKSLAGDQTDPAALVRTIATYVQKEYGYRAIAFGPRTQIPTPTTDIVAARFGDCKDHSLLFVQLLQSLDIPADLVLVSSGSPVIEEIPSLLQFNHMIARVPSLGLYVDLTDKYTDPLLQPPFALNAQFGLVLDPAVPSLQRLPDYPKPSGICNIEREIEASGRDLLVTEKITLTGLSAGWLRELMQVPQNKLVDQLATLYTPIGAELLEAAASGAEDTSEPLEVTTKYRVPGALTDVGGHTAVTLPYVLARRWYLFRRVDHRETPADFAYGTVCRETTRLRLGPGTKLVQPTALDWSMSSPPAVASRTIIPGDDDIVIRTSITVNQGFYTPAEYNQCASVTNDALTAFERDVVVMRPAKPE